MAPLNPWLLAHLSRRGFTRVIVRTSEIGGRSRGRWSGRLSPPPIPHNGSELHGVPLPVFGEPAGDAFGLGSDTVAGATGAGAAATGAGAVATGTGASAAAGGVLAGATGVVAGVAGAAGRSCLIATPGVERDVTWLAQLGATNRR